ncbi:P-loop containing nucleoside triphosphate hydrolase protein [Heliocybe sulcata]|uniref:P-loop containing nucleoside triphosphate hydrolase protein n=1 Tax=Heliocybe sulcata TaxID=5364 RepID=A0A5C3NJK8_9AGAM|nr:P-loop containing nucleoside triphosphate hydrolase protein [Heliocybe sulcata]
MQHGPSERTQSSSHPSLKRTFAQQAFAHADPNPRDSSPPPKVPRVNASRGRSVVSPAFNMPPPRTPGRPSGHASRSSANASWRNNSRLPASAPVSRQTSRERKGSKGKTRAEPDIPVLDEPVHDEQYVRSTYTGGLKSHQEISPKSSLANWLVTNEGRLPEYNMSTVIINRQKYQRVIVTLNSVDPPIIGTGDAPTKKEAEHLAALSAIIQLHQGDLVSASRMSQLEKKAARATSRASPAATVITLTDGTEIDYDRARQFMDYYCRRFKFAAPDISFNPVGRGKTSWEAVMYVGDRRIGIGAAQQKKQAQIQCYLDVVAYLQGCDAELWKEFVEAAKTGKDLGLAPKVYFRANDRLADNIRDLADEIRHSTLWRNYEKSEFAKRSKSDSAEEQGTGTSHPQRRNDLLGVSPAWLERKSKELLRRRQEYLSNPATEKMRQSRAALPVNTVAPKILQHVRENDVTICMATTGSGKTTQIPQLILDEWIEQGKGGQCNIVCTQPRRLAAVSVAERVAKERNEKCGEGSIGYNVRFEAKPPRDHGSVTFCTTGIFFKRMQSALLDGSTDLDNVTHVVIDEVHERFVDTDLLLVVMKRLLADRKARGRQPLKVILMSATIEPQLFQEYFPDDKGQPASVIEVPGRAFPVDKFFLGDFLPQLQAHPSSRWVFQETAVSKYIEQEMRILPPADMQSATRMINEDLDLPHPLVALTISHVLQQSDDGHVLVFLPGWDDITNVQRLLLERSWPMNFMDTHKFSIHLLHSTIPLAEQEVIFEPAPEGVRRIILATNIAETSVTIPDVVYVVDTGKVKEQRYDPERRITSLVSAWRAGRAGRHRPGQYFGLLSKQQLEVLQPYQTVEMKRVDLSNIVMHVKALQFPGMSVEEVLSAAIEAPAPERVTVAIKDLEMAGALDRDQNLTSLGRVLLQIPADVQLARLVLYGVFFRCVDHALTLAAIMGNRDPFVAPMHAREEAHRRKFSFASQEYRSDVLAALTAYNQWARLQESGQYVTANRFCVENFLSKPTLLLVQKTRNHLLQSLFNSGVIQVSMANERSLGNTRGRSVPRELNANQESLPVLAGLITVASQPKFAVRTSDTMYRTPEDKNVSIHPSSVNFRRRAKYDKGSEDEERQLYAYMEKRQNLSAAGSGGGQAQKYMVTSTRIDPLTYILFGAYETRATSQGLECDDWLPLVGDLEALDDVRRLKTRIEDCLLRVFEGIVASQNKSLSGRPVNEQEDDGAALDVDGAQPLSTVEVRELGIYTQQVVHILEGFADETRSRTGSRSGTPVSGLWSPMPRVRDLASGRSTPYNSRPSTPSRLGRR